MTFAERIAVNTRYTRSANVERDRGSHPIVEAYLPSAGGVELLDAVADAFGTRDQPRAWSLVGPYGSGKSSFALFLHELLGTGRSRTAARNVLAGEDDRVARRFARQRPWCRVALSGSDEPLPDCLLAALDDAATAYWTERQGRRPAVLRRIREARAQDRIPNSRLLELVDDLQEALGRAGAGGLLLLVDELGKFLEHEARQGGEGIFLLQQLAERAFKGRSANLVVVVLLHQGFDLYARGLGEKQRNDWAKVQGRFQSVSFVEPPEQILRIVAAAFSNTLTAAQSRDVDRRAGRFAKALVAAGALPPALDRETAAGIFAACYPIHPVALLLLPDLCQRFAQNERTLFSYLGSREPHGFRDALASLGRAGEWLHPATVYDYFVRNQPAVLSDPLAHRRWAEVVTAVERADRLDAPDGVGHAASALAKAVGLLNLVSRAGGLKASEDVLRLLFPRGPSFRAALDRLQEASVVQHRGFSGEYRVWQGTDFDIDERTGAETQKLGLFNLADVLRGRLETPAVVARRHSAETGTLRYFDVVLADPESRGPAPGAAGDAPRIVFVLAERRDHESAFHAMRRRAARPGDVWALHRDGAAVRTAVADVLALEAVQREAQELASDPVAAREIRARLGAARAAEREATGRLLGDPARSEWYRRGRRVDVADRRALQRALSDAMDRLYDETPVIRNELVNRNRLSSQAAAARNKLFRHMLEQERHTELGIRKYPPERAIYRSLLHAGRLHVETPKGWAFVPPGEDDPLRLRPVWSRIDGLMAESEDAPVPFDALADALAAPPVGLRRGAFPILFLHYYLQHRYEIAFYDEGVYSPTLTYEHLERLVRRPDRFAFQRFRIEGVRADLFDEYGRALLAREPDTADPLPLARALLRFAADLDDHARRTRRLSPSTLRVREALYFSKSPQKLLFEALPAACGHDPEGDLSGFAEKLKGALRELKQVQADLVDYMRAALCRAFGLDEATPLREAREVLRGRCHGLDRYTIDAGGLLTFIRRLRDRDAESHDAWFAGILQFLGRKPPAKWSDQDRDTAEYRLAQLSLRLLDLEKLRLHFASAGRSRSGHEVVLVKTVGDNGPLEQVAVLSPERNKATDRTLDEIRTLLAGVEDDELRLALVARLSRGFLAEYHEARLSNTEDEHERRKAR